MLLPAVAASFWAREVWSMTAIAAPMAFLSGAIGLLVSFHAGLPSGPLIVLVAQPLLHRLVAAGQPRLGARKAVASGSPSRLSSAHGYKHAGGARRLRVGVAFGAVGRWSGFCLRGAVEDALTTPGAPRARGFLLAMVVALALVQALTLDRPARSLQGGGAADVAVLGRRAARRADVRRRHGADGGCGTRMLVLAGGGNLRSVVVFFVFGFVAYATIRGILAPTRAAMMAASSVDSCPADIAAGGGGIVLVPALPSSSGGRVPARHLVGGALIGCWCRRAIWSRACWAAMSSSRPRSRASTSRAAAAMR
jgi:hypothetical protein